MIKKWIYSIVIILLVVILISKTVYDTAMTPKTTRIDEAVRVVNSQTSISTITHTSLFNGREDYVVIQGKNNKNENVIAWIPSDDKPVVTRLATEGITKEQAVAIVNRERKPKEIKKIVLGMEKSVPFWEITYIDDNGLYSFYYIDFETGDPIKRYALPK